MTAFTTRTVESDGVLLATRDYGGSGPALVLMHGGGMEQGSLEPLAEQLRGSFRVVTFDFRGHGGTGLAPWTFAASVQDVAAVAEAYGLGVPAVGGHSLGGMVATAYGVAHPSCPAVINIDGHGRGRVDQYVGLTADEVRAGLEHQRQRVDRLTRGVGAVAVRALLLLLRKRPTTTGATARQVLQEVESIDLFAWYRELACPLLVFNATAPERRRLMRLWAGNGVSLAAAFRKGLGRDLAALADELDRVQVATVDATHILVRTHPELVAREVAAFLSVARAV
jgi:pimeloyl-ACP methyl ester carboxylesterase